MRSNRILQARFLIRQDECPFGALYAVGRVLVDLAGKLECGGEDLVLWDDFVHTGW